MIFQTKDLSRRFPDGRWGIRDLNFTLNEKEFTLLVGANGSGKTLLVKHLIALEKPTSGSVLYKGQSAGKSIKELRSGTGVVFQHPEHQIIEQKVRDDLAFSLRFLNLKPDEINRKVSETAELLGLEDLMDSFTHTLSGGEKRRVALGGVLVLDPEVIIFDEPFTELDYPAIKVLLQHMKLLKEKGKTLLVVTHDVSKVLGFADRLVCMDGGQIVLDGDPADTVQQLEQFGVRNPLKSSTSVEDCLWLG